MNSTPSVYLKGRKVFPPIETRFFYNCKFIMLTKLTKKTNITLFMKT